MKSIDIKSLIIGALLTSTIFLGIAATSNIGNGTVKLDGPVDVRLSFGSSKATASNTSTPTDLDNLDTLNVKLSGEVTTVDSPNIGLPSNPSGKNLSSTTRPLIITVTKEGSYIVHTKMMDLANLKLVLKNSLEKNPDQKVIIRGDAKAAFSKTTAALAACAEAGYKTANIAWDTNLNE